MATNYAVNYQQALANAFPSVLHFGALWQTKNKDIYKVLNAKTIQIPNLTVTGRVPGSTGTITGASQRHSNDWETKELSNHRKWDTLVHPMDINQTNMVLSIQNITKAFNEQQKFKEMDCYAASKLYADWLSLENKVDTTVLTVENILASIDKQMEAMDEAEVPGFGRILYVTPKANTLIKQAKGLQRMLGFNDKTISRTINRIDELTIESVPSKILKTAYNFEVGAKPADGASQINMMFVHPDAVLPVTNYSFACLDEPSAKTEGKWLYFEESFEDIFILNKRAGAIAFNVTAAGE